MIPYRKALSSLLPCLCVANIFLFIFLVAKTAVNDHTRNSETFLRERARIMSQLYRANHSGEGGGQQNIGLQQIKKGSGGLHQSFLKDDNNENLIIIDPYRLPYKMRSLKELENRVVPNIVFYVWCGNRTFEYRHFLGVLSVWYQMEPDIIEFRYEMDPIEDKYNNWFTMLRTHIAAFNARRLPPFVKGDKCGSVHGLDTVWDRGGVYMDENTLLWGDDVSTLLSRSPSVGFFQNTSTVAFAASVARNGDLRVFQRSIKTAGRNFLRNYNEGATQKPSSASNILNFLNCSAFQAGERSTVVSNGSFCFSLPNRLTPWGILHNSKDPMCESIAQQLMLSNRDTLSPNTTLEIPRIVHYVWFGKAEFTFGMYLSFLSTVHVVNPTTIFIHWNYGLYGPYWDLVKEYPVVRLVYRDPPRYIFDHLLHYRQHLSDIVRADVLDKYGGIYLDWDAFWLRSPVELLKKTSYDVILSRDHMPRSHFPDTINMGVVMAKPRSKFIRRWRAALVNYKSSDFFYNAIELPYKVYESFPEGVLIEDRLQVMCYYLKCHPTWHPEFRRWSQAQPFDWRSDAYAIHFTYPDPPAFHNETALKTSEGDFAEMGRYIFNLRHKKAKEM
ncbi:uncharacterized protein LOC101855219 [Aplysia californica]|uniref:Uncharacterized protein LOC101855219 n=1 Tax=Aplysia californica TaxID=6500 RepID=A0ABM0K769_APLCA|nr:uncharacterized protein LOC101855219 [Aplysia californica]XP_035828732.1 uncharacterized protein LOC101855219 [Aplysia californica]